MESSHEKATIQDGSSLSTEGRRRFITAKRAERRHFPLFCAKRVPVKETSGDHGG